MQPTEEGVDEFLADTRRAVLFCHDRHGAPIGYPMSVVGATRRMVSFTTYAKSAKVGHLTADPAVGLILLGGDEEEPRWLSIEGRVEVVRPSEEEIASLFGRRAADPRVPSAITESVIARLRDGRRVVLRVLPDDPARLRVETGRFDGG